MLKSLEEPAAAELVKPAQRLRSQLITKYDFQVRQSLYIAKVHCTQYTVYCTLYTVHCMYSISKASFFGAPYFDLKPVQLHGKILHLKWIKRKIISYDSCLEDDNVKGCVKECDSCLRDDNVWLKE